MPFDGFLDCLYWSYGHYWFYSRWFDGDYRLLAIKSILDFIIILIMTSSLGKGRGFRPYPSSFQGSVTILARLIEPIMTEQTLIPFSNRVSSYFCVGVNIVWDRKIRVANMLPAILIDA